MKQIYEFIDVNLISYTFNMANNVIEFELLDMYEGESIAIFSIQNILEVECIIGYLYEGLIPAYLGKVTVMQNPSPKDLESVIKYKDIDRPLIYISIEGHVDIKILCLDCEVRS